MVSILSEGCESPVATSAEGRSTDQAVRRDSPFYHLKTAEAVGKVTGG